MKITPGTSGIAAAVAMAIAMPTFAQTSNGTCHALRADASPAAPAGNGGTNAGHDNHYVIGTDDVLSVSVWKEQDLTEPNLPVRLDGNISMPLIGEVHAAGQTPMQLEQEITTRLRAFLTQPEVNVMVVQMNSQKFNVMGRVLKPGSYKLSATTTVLDAIAQAGGFQDFAKQKSIYILRQDADGKETRIPFNYKSVIHGEHPEQNIHLEARDTIVVP